MIKPRCFLKIIFSVHLYVCYKLCYMLKIFSFVGQGKFQTTLRAAEIRWFFLRALRASWLLLALTLQYDIIYAPKLHNSALNFSNLTGMKMHGREARVNTSEWGTETPGQQVTVGLDWGEPFTPAARVPGERSSPTSAPSSQYPISFSLCALFLFPQPWDVAFHVANQGHVLFKTLLGSYLLQSLASPEFSLVLSSSYCLSSSLSLIL